jgi:fructose-specific component phosphotransferase system IIB-like protein
MIPTMQAELLIVDKKWGQAKSILDNHTSDIMRNSPPRLVPKLISQRAWCSANLGEIVSAAEDLERALVLGSTCTDDDDLAVLQFRLSNVCEIIENPELASSCLDSATKHLALFREHQNQIRKMLTTVVERISKE